jgi:hypothetical protein
MVNTELKTRKVTFISHQQALYQYIDVYMESFGQQKSYVNHISRYINLKYTSAHTFKEGDPLRNEAITYQGFCCIGVLTEMIVHPPSASEFGPSMILL